MLVYSTLNPTSVSMIRNDESELVVEFFCEQMACSRSSLSRLFPVMRVLSIFRIDRANSTQLPRWQSRTRRTMLPNYRERSNEKKLNFASTNEFLGKLALRFLRSRSPLTHQPNSFCGRTWVNMEHNDNKGSNSVRKQSTVFGTWKKEEGCASCSRSYYYARCFVCPIHTITCNIFAQYLLHIRRYLLYVLILTGRTVIATTFRCPII